MKTEIAVVLDRSGSMGSVRDDTIGGFNAFLEKQKEIPGDVTITLVQFDNLIETVLNAVRVTDAAPLTKETYVPRASTALLDAIGETINSLGKRLSGMPKTERPEKVIFVIITDGYENASRVFKQEEIDKMISLQRDTYKWEFIFLGANQDAIAAACNIGIAAVNAMTYSSTPVGVADAFAVTAQNVQAYASGESLNVSYSTDQLNAQKQLIDKLGH